MQQNFASTLEGLNHNSLNISVDVQTIQLDFKHLCSQVWFPDQMQITHYSWCLGQVQ
jgi:hypothetical protein